MKKTMINDISQIRLGTDRRVACIGFFDGVHLGHQTLINKTIERAKELGVQSTLITFNPDPWSVLNNKSSVKHITPIKEKLNVLESLGLDETIVINFTKSFAGLAPEEFVNQVLIDLGIVELVVGEDFKFGKKGSGNVSYLKEQYEHAFTTHVMTIKKEEQNKIGSTQIIQSIIHGDLEKTSSMLGRYYTVSGFVIDGQKQGRKIGFPTANLDIVDEYVLPKPGVYAGYTQVDDRIFKSIINIGYNPTFNTRDEISVETHLLDFDEDIYQQVIHQSFVKRLRDELKFETIDELIKQMQDDEQEARILLKDVV